MIDVVSKAVSDIRGALDAMDAEMHRLYGAASQELEQAKIQLENFFGHAKAHAEAHPETVAVKPKPKKASGKQTKNEAPAAGTEATPTEANTEAPASTQPK